MSLFQIIVLAVIQGLTEFLPISSSGHLVISQKLFGFSQAPVAFDVLLHLGSLIAIIIFFRKSLQDLILNWRKNLRLFSLIVIASIPAALLGLFFKKPLEKSFENLQLVACSYLATAFMLFSLKYKKDKKNEGKKSLKEINFLEALKIGCFQALAILPGISRSGSTIVIGLWSGLSSPTAFTFSFFLAIPAIAGATFLELPEMVSQNGKTDLALWGMLVAIFISYLTLSLLQKVLQSKKLYLFGWYCLLLGIFLFFMK